MAETRGIEIFGRGATIVDTSVGAVRRSPWPGVLSVVLGLLAAAATGMGVVSTTEGATEAARWWAYGGIGAGILGVVVGFLAAALNRGAGAAVVGMVLATLGNPWVLTRVLEAAAPLVR